MDFEKMKSYFSDNGDWIGYFAFLLMVGGLITLRVSTGIGIAVMILGFAVFAILCLLSVKKISDDEYDSIVTKYADSLKSRAMSKLGVDESKVNEIAPIFMGGYDFEGADKFKQGNDKIWRSNVYKSIMLFFSRNELHCYTIRFKTTENLILGEGTDVYFYQDIVSASTASESNKITIGGKETIINSEVFRLTTKGGTSLTVNIIDSRHAQESVNAMRALLREKKSS